MQSVTKNAENMVFVKAGVIFALVVIAAFSPVVFLDQSYNRNSPIPPELLGYENKSTVIGIATDYSDSAVWPNVKLATDMMLNGVSPLWNPTVGVGAPLAAESTYHIFSPYNLGFFLPPSLWDVPILIGVWVAGFFMFLFLRSLNLKFVPAVTGGVFFMLAGSITCYLTNPNFLVVMVTPLVFYSIEKIIQNRDPKFIILVSISFFLTVLTGHLETIVIQFLFVAIYFTYRIIILGKINRKKIASIFFPITGFIGGLGLGAFYIIPIYELVFYGIGYAQLEHGIGYGLKHNVSASAISPFIPYIFGQLHAYWLLSAERVVAFTGYVGIFVLFFSIVGVYLSLKNSDDKTHRYTPLFFLCVAIFFMMKIIGVPVVNSISNLPILEILHFMPYLGVIIPFCFAVSAAFGINLLPKMQVSKKTLSFIFIFTITLLGILLVPLYSYLGPDAEFPEYVSANDARNYVGFQILQAVLFAVMAFMIAIAITKNKSTIIIIIPLVLLELSLYIPFGLHPISLAYKFAILFVGIIALTLLALKPNGFLWNTDTKRIKLPVLFGILIIIFLGVVLISEFSSFGMMKKIDSFEDNQVTDFLKTNLEYHRMFSFDYTMGPNYPSAYNINSIGFLSPFTIDSFRNFTHNFLDDGANVGRLGVPPWTYYHGPMESIQKFHDNKKYFDFLGVKYILTEGYNFDTIAVGIPGNTRELTKIQATDYGVSQSFVSPVNSITSLDVSLSAFQLEKNDTIILSVDSVPYDEKYHRESVLTHIKNQKYNQFNLEPQLENVLNKQLIFSLQYPQLNDDKFVAVHTITEGQTVAPHLETKQDTERNVTKEKAYDYAKNELQAVFYENNSPIDTKQMVFAISSDSGEHEIAFQFEDIYIHENNDVYPRVFLVNNFETVEADTAQEYLLQNSDFDLRQNVILEEELPDELISKLSSSSLNEIGNADIISYEANNVMIETVSDEATLLILTEVYYPGWKAFIDGAETKIYRADGLVRAVFVPEGNHAVEFVYLPESYSIGITISVVSAIILGVSYVILQKRSVRKRELKNFES